MLVPSIVSFITSVLLFMGIHNLRCMVFQGVCIKLSIRTTMTGNLGLGRWLSVKRKRFLFSNSKLLTDLQLSYKIKVQNLEPTRVQYYNGVVHVKYKHVRVSLILYLHKSKLELEMGRWKTELQWTAVAYTYKYSAGMGTRVHVHYAVSHVHSDCAKCKSSIKTGQMSCAWPIFEIHVTLDLNHISANKFHHSTSTHS